MPTYGGVEFKPSICCGRSPHGERGLKRLGRLFETGSALSLPARGAWIETVKVRLIAGQSKSRSPHGERGLKHSGHAGRSARRHVAPRTGSVD